LKRALILGVSGQDGAYLSRFLLDKGYSVHGASRDAQVNPFTRLSALGIKEDVHLESLDITDLSSVLQALRRIKPDEIYNLASQSSVSLSFQQPVETFASIAVGTINVLEAIRFSDRPIKFYSAGSSECFGDTVVPADETSPFRPLSPYAAAKSAAAWVVSNYREAYDIFACTGMLFNHESPLRPARFVTKKIVSSACRIAAGSREKLSIGNLDVVRDWGWAPDYVDAMWRMLQQREPVSLVIASGHSYSLREFVAVAFEHAGLDWQEHVVVDPALFRPTDLAIGKANPARAAVEIGWTSQYAMPDVVRMMVEAERSGFGVEESSAEASIL